MRTLDVTARWLAAVAGLGAVGILAAVLVVVVSEITAPRALSSAPLISCGFGLARRLSLDR